MFSFGDIAIFLLTVFVIWKTEYFTLSLQELLKIQHWTSFFAEEKNEEKPLVDENKRNEEPKDKNNEITTKASEPSVLLKVDKQNNLKVTSKTSQKSIRDESPILKPLNPTPPTKTLKNVVEVATTTPSIQLVIEPTKASEVNNNNSEKKNENVPVIDEKQQKFEGKPQTREIALDNGVTSSVSNINDKKPRIRPQTVFLGDNHGFDVKSDGGSEDNTDDDEDTSQQASAADASRSSAADYTNEEKMKLHSQHRNLILQELLETEETYVQNLRILQDSFQKPLSDFTIISKKSHEALFGNISVIIGVNELMLKKLRDCISTRQLPEPNSQNGVGNNTSGDCGTGSREEMLGECLLKISPSFRLYTTYIIGYEKSFDVVREESQRNSQFAQFLKKTSIQLIKDKQRISEITSYLILPVQRLPRYKLLLEDLLKHIPPHWKKAKSNLEAAKNALASVTDYLNEKQNLYGNLAKIFEINEKLKIPNLIQPNRQFLATTATSNDIVKEYRRKSIIGNIGLNVGTVGEMKSGRSLYLFSDLLIVNYKGKILGSPKNIEIPINDIMSLQISSEKYDGGFGLTIFLKSLSYTFVFQNEETCKKWLGLLEKQKANRL